MGASASEGRSRRRRERAELVAPADLPFVPELQAARLHGLWACAVQAVCAAVAMGTFAVRRSVLVLVVNPVFVAAALAGALGAKRLSPGLIFVHYAVSLLVSLVTVVFMAVAAAFGSLADTGTLLVVHAPLAIDVACGLVSWRLAVVLHATRVRFSEGTDHGQAWRAVRSLDAEDVTGVVQGVLAPPSPSPSSPSPSASPLPSSPRGGAVRVDVEEGGGGGGLLQAAYDGGPLCLICFDRPRDALLYPCGHRCCCTACGNQLRRVGMTCPVCRQDLRDVVRIWE